MKNLMTLIFLITLSFNLSAQANCDCKPELDFVYDQMQTTYSFKDQIKGDQKEIFESLYQKLSTQMTGAMSLPDCFWKLNQLMSLVNDKHAEVFEKKPDFEADKIYDSAFVKAYRATDAFLNFPKATIDLDALTAELKLKAASDIEGIYNIGSVMKMGVYRIDDTDSLVGVILQSQLGTWAPGQVFAYLKGTQQADHYDIAFYNQVYKHLTFAKAQYFANGMLFSNVIKENAGENHSLINGEEKEGYVLSNLTDDVQYVWLNSFNRRTMATKRDALIEQIENELKAPNLIIDLRNNGGGADKISLPILKALKKKTELIYVITNFYTGSNAEMTTVRLKQRFNATQLGQRTYGAISYGSNYGKTFHSSSGLFSFYPTDMRQRQFIEYEEIGVAPDIALKADTDWIEQTLNYIKTQKQ
ncbi:hypothetical protein OB69_17240 [Roseivirga seohaensis subsp. aquiponti]|uniref:Tail specific protease domain-containing protein n=1 Tax=Roseivirga seohaensis subsp. aquiponti TaxID=1566026 RepID=A0A0L8AH34_9BACT|nr:S41 family peptidase [Roseivirga seohaensis]KOF01460.1 hypothetical protein OB69_17240 [Roseivirga seohaensis subsp. aquiponti]